MHAQPVEEPSSGAQADNTRQSHHLSEATSERLAWAKRELSEAERSGDLCAAGYAQSRVASVSSDLAILTNGASS